MSLHLGDDKLFIRPKHNNIYTFYDSILYIWFETIICLLKLSCELWNRKLKINEILFKKNIKLKREEVWGVTRENYNTLTRHELI